MTNTISFKGQTVTLDEDPRIGVCNRCRYVVGEVHPVTGKIYQRSHMHHETYNPNNVLADTIETCPPCHRKADWENHVKKTGSKQIKITSIIHQRLGKLVEFKGETYDQIINKCIDAYLRERKQKRHD